MELDPHQREKLNQQLAALPPGSAISLLLEVQSDQLRGGDLYSHKFVLTKLIQILAGQGFKPEFLEQPKVLFREPFDAFLVDVKNDPKQRGTILRASLDVIWDWIATDLFLGQIQGMENKIIKALMANKPDDARALMSEFHQQVGDKIWSVLSPIEEGSREHIGYNAKFGKVGIFEDALEMARALQIAPALIQLRSKIRRGLTLNHDADVHHCHGLYMQFLSTADQHAELGMLLIAGRLENTYEILKLIKLHTTAEIDTDILRDPASQSGTLVLSNLQDSIGGSIKLISRYSDFPLVAKNITEFYHCTELFTSLVELSRKSLWGNMIFQNRNDLSTAIEQQIVQLPRLINLLRYKKGAQKFTQATNSDDIGPSDYDIRQAVFIASLLRLAGRYLDQLSINDAYTKAKNEANIFVDSVAEIIVDELAKCDRQEKDTVLKYFKPMVELTLILQGEELASLLERRGDSAFRAFVSVEENTT